VVVVTGIPPNFAIVTLGVQDLDVSVAFYRALGWELHGDTAQGIVWFRTAGSWIGLFPHRDLADDAGLEPDDVALPAYRGSTLALNLPTEAAVDAGVETALAAGARLVKRPVRLEWGGYSGYVADPDGHLWELCFNPGFPLDDQGRIEIP
jgi:catechol 2,3-dioxygenase-like lactoylglutathione lyase family enzyme